MGIRIAETSNGVVVNLIQQKLDGKLSPSVFQAKAVSKNRFGIITKDMWYKIHPLPTVLFANAFISARRQEPPLLSQTTDTTGTTGKTNEVLAREGRQPLIDARQRLLSVHLTFPPRDGYGRYDEQIKNDVHL